MKFILMILLALMLVACSTRQVPFTIAVAPTTPEHAVLVAFEYQLYRCGGHLVYSDKAEDSWVGRWNEDEKAWIVTGRMNHQLWFDSAAEIHVYRDTRQVLPFSGC